MAALVVVVSPPLNAAFAPTIAAGVKAAGACVGNAFQLAVPCPTKSGNNGPIGIVQAGRFTDVDGLAARLVLQIYSAAFADAGDGVAFAPGAGAENNYVGTVLVNPTDWLTLGSVGYATVSAYGMASQIVGKIWYAQLVAVDALTTVTPDGIRGAISGIIT